MLHKFDIANNVTLFKQPTVLKYLIEGERGFIWTQVDEQRIIHNLSQYYDLS